MQKIAKLSVAFALILFAASCGSSSKDGNAAINDKKAKLEKLKAEKNKNDEDIRKLQEELVKIDTNTANAAKVKLVSVAPVTTQNFQHYINLQGKVDADNISYISTRGMGGQIKAIYVKEGQAVKKGQLLLKLDDAVLRQQVTAARQQLDGIKTQLSYAKNIYQRQKNLWDQGIGTEVQLITAKTNVTSLENQLQATGEQVKVSEEQLKTANVYSDVSGIADIVSVRLGETFPGMGQIKIVNTSSLKAVTTVPENYLSRVHRGSEVVVSIPDVNKEYKSTINLISQVVDASNRGFVAEAKIPYDAALKPNQVATVRILDYNAANAIVIPVNVIQSDETGKYLFVQVKSGNGKTVAKRRSVLLGEIYGDKVEIKGGLAAGEQLITEGYQNLYDGQGVTTQVK